MNRTRFTIMTDNDELIKKLKEDGIPIIQNNEFVYTSIVAVCAEVRLCDFIAKCAEETKANIAVHIFYQDPCGESSGGIMYFIEGKAVS